VEAERAEEAELELRLARAAAEAMEGIMVGPARCCPPRHPTRSEPSCVVPDGIS
jgi:hypothetical protein